MLFLLFLKGSDFLITFYNAGELMFAIGKIGLYTIIYRPEQSSSQWVAAYLFNGQVWGQGHYYESFFDAVKYAYDMTLYDKVSEPFPD